MMTRRENLLKALRHQRPDWIPITGHVDPYNQPNRRGMDPELAEMLHEVHWGDESIVRFSRYLGLDIFDWVGPPIRSSWSLVAYQERWDGDTLYARWETPRGVLCQQRRRNTEDNTCFALGYPVKSVDDVPALAALFENQQYALDEARAAALSERQHLIGDDGIIALAGPGTPLGDLVRIYSGVQTLAFLCVDHPRELGDLLAAMEQSYLAQVRLMAESCGEAIVTVDDTSTTAISPRMFREFEVPYTHRAAAVAHRAGKLYVHHSCGHVRDLLDDYAQTPMDAVHALCVPPIGNVTIAEARRRLGSRIAIMPPLVQMFAPMADREAVRRSIRQMFQEAAPGDNVVFGLAADPTKTMDETRFVLDEARKYQRPDRG